MNTLQSRRDTIYRFESLQYDLTAVRIEFEKLNFDFLTKPESESLIMLLKPILDLREKLIRRANSLPGQYNPDIERLIVP